MRRLQQLRHTGSAVAAHGLTCSMACGNLLDQGSNPCALHRGIPDSEPLDHQKSPQHIILNPFFPSSSIMTSNLNKVSRECEQTQWKIISKDRFFNFANYHIHVCTAIIRRYTYTHTEQKRKTHHTPYTYYTGFCVLFLCFIYTFVFLFGISLIG